MTRPTGRAVTYTRDGLRRIDKWKIRGVRGGNPIRSEERIVKCNCPDDLACR